MTQFVKQCKTVAIIRRDESLPVKMKTPTSVFVGFFFGENCLSIKFVARPVLGFVLVVFLSFLSAAQQTPPPASPAPPAPQTETSAKPTAAPGQAKDPAAKTQDAQGTSGQGTTSGTSNDRLFFTLPNFLTLENGGKVPPLTTGQKYKVVARGSFDYVQYPWYGFLAGISQAEDSEPGYGQGAKGYGKRFASAFADGTLENFMTGAVLPSLLRQDPRFFQSGKGGFTQRTGYAVSRIVVTRTDSGGTQFNYSEVFGSALSAAISTNTYHPRAFITTRYDPTTGMSTYVHNASSRTLTNTASVWGTQVGYDTITIVVKEFWPDIHRKLSHKHKGEAAHAGNANP
jgi:hypothetical protein